MYWCLLKCCDFFFRIQSHLSLIWKTCSNFLKKNKRSIVNRQAMFLFVPLWRIQDEVHAGNLTFNRENEAFLHFDIVLRQGDSERTVQVFVLLFQGKQLHTNAPPYQIDTDNKPDGPSPSIFFKRKFTSHLSDTEHISTLPHSILNEH